MTETRRSDQLEMVSLAGAGDPTAQERLIALVRRRVRTISLAILGHQQDAEDATQCILLEILKSAPTYRGDSLFAWSDRIAVRTAARHARQRRVRATHFDAETALEAVGAAPAAYAAEQAIPRPVTEYLSELPEARRTALVMRHVLGYSVEEIATLTETSPNTVKDRLLQARRQVRRRIRHELVCLPQLNRTSP